MGRAGDRRWRAAVPLALLLALAYLLSALWALAIPVPSGAATARWWNFHPDENSHIAVVLYIAGHGALPPYQRPYDTSIHPPLYHAAAALAFRVMRALGGTEDAALLGLRLLTALCGVGTVYLTYAAVRRLSSRRAALLAAAIVALIPMRVSLGGAINNENLAMLGAAGSLAALVGGLTDGFDGRRLTLLSLWLLVGIGSKVTCLGLLPIALAALLMAARRRGLPISVAAWQAMLVTGVLLIGIGWWFVRNTLLYGDPLRKAAADRLWDAVQPGYAAMLAKQGTTALHYLVSLLGIGWLSFWGLFDGFQYRLPALFYGILLGTQGAALLGACFLWRSGWFSRRWERSRALGLSAFFAGYVFLIYVQYNWRHYTPQGRYFFVLLLPFGWLTAVGWRALFHGAGRRFRDIASAAVAGMLLLINLYAVWVMPQR